MLVAGFSAGLVYTWRRKSRESEVAEPSVLNPVDSVGFTPPPRPSGLFGTLEAGIVYVHDSTGLPWWGCLVLCSAGLRITLLPLLRFQIKHASRVAALKPQLDAAWASSQQHARQQHEQFVHYARQARTIFSKAKVNPFKSFAISLAQIPIFISMVLTVRQMVMSGRYPSLAEGGALWFLDLSLADASYGLPVLNITLMIVNLQIAFGKSSGRFLRVVHRVLLLLLAATFPIVSQFPAGVFVYWVANSSCSLLQGFMLRRPAIQKLLRRGLPAPRNPQRPSHSLAAPQRSAVAQRPPAALSEQAGKEFQRVQDIVESYTAANQSRPAAEKQAPLVVAAEIRKVIAEERRKGSLTTPIVVMLRGEQTETQEAQVVVGVVSDQEELALISQLIDALITKHVGEGQPNEVACAAINKALRHKFEIGEITAPAQVTLSHNSDGDVQLEVDLGIGNQGQ